MREHTFERVPRLAFGDCRGQLETRMRAEQSKELAGHVAGSTQDDGGNRFGPEFKRSVSP